MLEGIKLLNCFFYGHIVLYFSIFAGGGVSTSSTVLLLIAIFIVGFAWLHMYVNHCSHASFLDRSDRVSD